jgi:hypothetical protein
MIATLAENSRKAPRKLAVAVAELRRLVECQRARDKQVADVINLLASYQQRERDYAAAFRIALENGSVDEVRTSFEKWAASRPLAEAAVVELSAIVRWQAQGVVLGVMLAKEPTAKQVLLTVCELKLSAAKTDAERVSENEARRLGPEFEPDDIEASPVVRRAARKVTQLETIQKRISSEPIASVWNLAEGLLNE